MYQRSWDEDAGESLGRGAASFAFKGHAGDAPGEGMPMSFISYDKRREVVMNLSLVARRRPTWPVGHKAADQRIA